jgi:hypothetical protein
MKPLRDWTFARVVLVCIGWVLGVLLVPAFGLWWYFRPTVESTGSGGVGAVVLLGLVLAIPFVPPFALFIVWLILRRRR